MEINLINNHIQNIFGLSSLNFHNFPNLWMKNIELFIPQIFNLININSDYKSNIIDMVDIENINITNNINSKTIQSLFNNYGSDKGQTYSSIYTFLLNKFNNNIRLLEIGLGTNNPHLVSSMGIGKYKCGSSLRSFRDYLPNSNIYGADIDIDCLFEEENIKTFFVDQLNIETFDKLYINCGNKHFDVIIDDGLHSIGANINTIIFALKSINSKGVIIIEDIPYIKIQAYQIVDYILKDTNKYITTFVTYNNKSGFVYVIEVL